MKGESNRIAPGQDDSIIHEKLFNAKLKKEVLRFLVGGGSAVLVDFIGYYLLMRFGMNRAIAKAASFICGSIVGFVINKFWTFGSKKFSKLEIGKYIILYTCTALINAGINSMVLYALHLDLLAFFCATAISTILNFFGQKFFVFYKADSKSG